MRTWKTNPFTDVWSVQDSIRHLKQEPTQFDFLYSGDQCAQSKAVKEKHICHICQWHEHFWNLLSFACLAFSVHESCNNAVAVPQWCQTNPAWRALACTQVEAGHLHTLSLIPHMADVTLNVTADAPGRTFPVGELFLVTFHTECVLTCRFQRVCVRRNRNRRATRSRIPPPTLVCFPAINTERIHHCNHHNLFPSQKPLHLQWARTRPLPVHLSVSKQTSSNHETSDCWHEERKETWRKHEGTNRADKKETWRN